MSDDARLMLVFDAKIDKVIDQMNKLNRSVHGAASGASKEIKGLDDAFNRLFSKAEPSKAIANIFDRSRLAVLEEGAARIPIFGSAIEALGPAGLLAAAGIGAMAMAMERTHEAVEWGANIAKAAKTAGTSAGFIQEFNFAAQQNEVDVQAAGEALKGLNTSLGLVQSGLAKKQLVNAFKALGFTPDQLRQFHDVGDLFPVLADRMASVGNAAERAAIAKRLGIAELLPMLREGENGFASLAAKAQRLGIVMDSGLVKQAEEAKEKLNEIGQVMKAKANIEFVQFADTLIAIKGAFLQAELAGLSFIAKLTGTQSPVEKLKDDAAGLRALLSSNGGAAGLRNNPVGMHLAAGYEADIQAQKKALADRRVANVKADTEFKGAGAGGDVKPLVGGTAKKAPVDRSKQALSEADKALQEQLAAVLAARIQIASDQLELDKRQLAPLGQILADIDARTALEKEELDDQTKVKQDELKTKADNIRSAKDISAAAKKRALADISAAQDATDAAATQKRIAIQKKAEYEQLQETVAAVNRSFEDQKLSEDTDDQILQIQQQQATTLAARRTIALQLLQNEQDRARDELQNQFETGQISGDQYTARSNDLTRLYNARSAAAVTDMGGPIEQYIRSVQDLNTEFQDAAVGGIKQLSSGLADAVLGAKNLGQVFSSVMLQMERDILDDLFNKLAADTVGGLLGGFHIPGFASGTNSAPGGVALVGEAGPELVNLPSGSQVIPNSALASIGLPPSGSSQGGYTIIQPLVFNAQGAVMTSDVLQQANAIAAQQAGRAYQQFRTDQALAARRQGKRLGS